MSARMLRQCNDVRAARKRRLLSIQIDEFFEYLKSIKLDRPNCRAHKAEEGHEAFNTHLTHS
jgi:hypothetical protein